MSSDLLDCGASKLYWRLHGWKRIEEGNDGDFFPHMHACIELTFSNEHSENRKNAKSLITFWKRKLLSSDRLFLCDRVCDDSKPITEWENHDTKNTTFPRLTLFKWKMKKTLLSKTKWPIWRKWNDKKIQKAKSKLNCKLLPIAEASFLNITNIEISSRITRDSRFQD